MTTKIPFYLHDLGQAELNAVADALKDPILTTGERVEIFETQLAAYLGCKYVVAVSSCTAALQLSLQALDIGPGDEVITTPLTFVATVEAICHSGAYPVLVDVEPDTGNLDIAKVEAAITPRTKAVLPVHLYGLMVDMNALRELANQYHLKIIEDAAHCLEGSREGIRPAQLSDTTCFSFFATKSITCGEGGAVALNNFELYKRLKLLRTHGMTKTSVDRFQEGYRHWDVIELGWKFNLSNISAALLIPQLMRLEKNWEKRKEIAARYKNGLEGLSPLIRFPQSRPETKHAHHLFTIWVPENRRDEIIQVLWRSGIGAVVNYRPIHWLSWYKQFSQGMNNVFPAAEKIGRRTISLPFYPTMSNEDVHKVIQVLWSLVKK